MGGLYDGTANTLKLSKALVWNYVKTCITLASNMWNYVKGCIKLASNMCNCVKSCIKNSQRKVYIKTQKGRI